MQRALFAVTAIGLLSSAPLLADDGVNAAPAAFSKRELAACMTRRMYANRTLSYNDAAKACKDQLRGRKADAALNDAALNLNKAPKPVG